MGPSACSLWSAELLRMEGSQHFTAKRFPAAIQAYTLAIRLCPDTAMYWADRALCYLKLNEWEKVEEDSRQAVKLDSNLVQARFILGAALVQREHAGGLVELEKALDLARSAYHMDDMVGLIWKTLAVKKYEMWEIASTKKTCELQRLKEVCESALKEKHSHELSQMEGFINDFNAPHLEQLVASERVFKKAAEYDVPAEFIFITTRQTLSMKRGIRDTL